MAKPPRPTTRAISIHALREEGDSIRLVALERSATFQSTPSVRRATILEPVCYNYDNISIHALREEGDRE